MPVSLATPELIHCGACGYRGVPSADVTARLREAAEMLRTEAVGDRQLTIAQRRALTRGAKSEGCVFAALMLLGWPFFLMVASNLIGGLRNEGAEARRQLLAGCSYVPTLVILAGLATVAFFQLRRMRGALEASCAALPPGRAGEPAGCYVCGGPVAPRGVEVVARCTFCGADNIVAPEVVHAAAPLRRAQMGSYAEHISSQARALASAGRSRALMWVAAVPLFTCLCGCPNIFLGYRLGLAESPTSQCEHVLIETSVGRCVAEQRAGVAYIDGHPVEGAVRKISGARGMPYVRERGSTRTGQIWDSMSRARVCGESVSVRWDDGARTSSVPMTQLCWTSAP